MSEQPSNPKKQSHKAKPAKLDDVLTKHWADGVSLTTVVEPPPAPRQTTVTASFIHEVEAAAPRWVLLPVPVLTSADANRFMSMFRRRNLDAVVRRSTITAKSWSVYVRVKPTVDN